MRCGPIEGPSIPMKKVGVLGSGQVGEVLADGFLKHGYEVMRGSRDASKLADWKAGAGANASTGTFAETAAFAENRGPRGEGHRGPLGPGPRGGGHLDGKIVSTSTNPISRGASPERRCPVLHRAQRLPDGAASVGPPRGALREGLELGRRRLLRQPEPPGRPTMFICGNDAAAKDVPRHPRAVRLGHRGLRRRRSGARHRAAVQLWCVPGFLRNDWVHAFKMLRP